MNVRCANNISILPVLRQVFILNAAIKLCVYTAMAVVLWGVALDHNGQLVPISNVLAADFGGSGGGSSGGGPENDPDEPPCEPSDNMCCDRTGTQNKVVLYSGAETFHRTDMVVNGNFPIVFSRNYDSRSTYDSTLGYGWSDSHNFRIYEYPDDSVILRSGCGVKTRYIKTGNAYQRQAGGLLANLTEDNGNFTVDYLNGQRQYFDTQGRLLWWQDKAGNRLQYTYNPAGKLPLTGASQFALDPSVPMVVSYYYQLSRIEEHLAGGSVGNYLDLAYNPTTGRLTQITSNDGRIVTYEHDVTNGSTLGNLVKVNGLESLASTYKYEDMDADGVMQDYHNITYIQEGIGSTPVIEQYDDRDRVVYETYGNRNITFNYIVDYSQTQTVETIVDSNNSPIHTITNHYEFDLNGYVNKHITGEGLEVETQRTGLGLIEREEYFKDINGARTSIKLVARTFYPNGKIATEISRLDKGTAATTDDETITTVWTYDDTLVATVTKTWSGQPAKNFKTETLYNHDTNGKPTTIQAVRRYKDDGVNYLETSYTYNANGDVLTTTYPDDHIVENEYGSAYGGRYVTRMFHYNASGGAVPDLEQTYEYDNKNNRNKATDAKGHYTISSYDDQNRRETVTNHLGHLTTFDYDADNNLKHIIRDRTVPGDQLDDTRLNYDGLNQLTMIERGNTTEGFQLRSTMRRDSAGNVIARGDAYGVETLFNYDLENRLARITDVEGNYIQYTLNGLGQRVATNFYKSGGTLVRESSAEFDDLNRQQKLIGAINQTTSFSYDAIGNRISTVDALSRPATEYTYDSLGRLTNIKDANYDSVRDNQTIYQYDGRDRLRFVTDPRKLTTEYQYNVMGQLSKLISPDTGTTEYTYDLAGNRETQKDARAITVTYAYDELNRITGKVYPSTALNVTYSYDQRINGLGKLTGMTDSEGVTEYDYDTSGNLLEQRRTANDHTYATHYDYDNNDQLTKVTYPSGRIVDYVRNPLGQVTNIATTSPGGGQVAMATSALLAVGVSVVATAESIAGPISYLPFGGVEDITWGNGLTLDQSFDHDYLLTNQALGAIYNRTYGYDAVNNIKMITDNIASGKSQAFNYDVLDRLDDATGVYGLEDYVYDDVGNRTSLVKDGAPTVYGYSPTANQLVDIDGAAIGYDANGNTLAKASNTFSYDNTNRMTQANAVTYGYNGKGERVRKTNGGTTTLYHYDLAGNLLFESDAAGTTLVEYIWLGSQRIAMVQGGSLYFSHVDHLGTVQLMTDAGSGAVVWQGDYRPFGEVVVAGSVVNNLRFPGQYYDAETQLNYNYFRDYDPGTGRYVESDPIGLVAGTNTYIYAQDNPLFFTDFNGLLAGPGILVIEGFVNTVLGAIVIYNGTSDSTEDNDVGQSQPESDPVSGLQPTNPGTDCDGKCNPCPPPRFWIAPGNAHGSTNGTHAHGIVWNQDPSTCMCYPRRVSGPDLDNLR